MIASKTAAQFPERSYWSQSSTDISKLLQIIQDARFVKVLICQSGLRNNLICMIEIWNWKKTYFQSQHIHDVMAGLKVIHIFNIICIYVMKVQLLGFRQKSVLVSQGQTTRDALKTHIIYRFLLCQLRNLNYRILSQFLKGLRFSRVHIIYVYVVEFMYNIEGKFLFVCFFHRKRSGWNLIMNEIWYGKTYLFILAIHKLQFKFTRYNHYLIP